MKIRIIATITLLSGVLTLGIAVTPAANGAPAPAPLLAPSPRPTLVPTATPRPTARPSHKAVLTQYGRLTGTVIDQTTGAPSAGVRVHVGDYTVSTDANGNYDTWVPVGAYSVSLALSQAQGTSVQSNVIVDITARTPTVQHLYYASPAPAIAVPQATAAPSAVPSAVPSPVPSAAGTVAARAPKKLPVTGNDDSPLALWLWLALFMVVGGSVLNSRPVRTALVGRALVMNAPISGDNLTLLMTLLTTAPRRVQSAQPPASGQDDALLEALLNRKHEQSVLIAKHGRGQD